MIFTHNGLTTIQSPTGDHRTFRVVTQPEKSSFAPGMRVVGILIGANNENPYCYRPFAFVSSDGVKVWKRFQSYRLYNTYADMLCDPEKWIARGFSYEYATTCRKCNRTLTTPESIKTGIGPVCAKSGS